MGSEELSEKPLKPLNKKGNWKNWLQRLRLDWIFRHAFETEEDFQRLIDKGEENGIIEEEEHELIQSVFEFGDTIVREVMVPRIEMAATPLKTTVNDVLDIIIQTGHSRIPVYDQRMDNIVGIIYAKDLLKIIKAGKVTDGIDTIVKLPYFVPETKKIMDLLKEFQTQKIHMAIVVDEYGGTAGLVTIEDLLEELVGEIQDEHDYEREKLIRLDDETISVDARIEIEEIEDFFNCKIPKEDFETVSGLLFHLFEKIPKEGEEIVYKGLKFIVTKGDERMVRRVKISKLNMEDLGKELD